MKRGMVFRAGGKDGKRYDAPHSKLFYTWHDDSGEGRGRDGDVTMINSLITHTTHVVFFFVPHVPHQWRLRGGKRPRGRSPITVTSDRNGLAPVAFLPRG
jgi:hypothetical protein